ncbi:MAG: cytochrome c biogenesis protein CcdA [Planctomycetota bacterium]|jgi:thiol:disulfide interchange protein DsbD
MSAEKLRFSVWTVLGVLALAFPVASLAQFGLAPVEVSFAPETREARTGETVSLAVTFHLAPGFHLYRDKTSFRWDSLSGLEAGRVRLPAGEAMEDPAGGTPGETIVVFHGEAVVRVEFTVTAAAGEAVSLAGVVEYQGCEENFCHPPASHPIRHDFGKALPPAGPVAPPSAGEAAGAPVEALPAPPAGKPLDLDLGHLLIKILQAFGIGFLISLTPCVYPMIGITAAIVGGTAAGGERNVGRTLLHAATYVLGLSLTYAVLGVLTALAGAPMARFLKSGWILLPISGVFVLLSLAMFDVIQIRTPAFIQNRLSGVGRGGTGLPSKFALGLVSGVVATPCVAAPLIAVLVEVVTLNAAMGLATAVVYGIAMLFAMAWGMGVVLIFAGVMTANVLPRSGPWMVWIKKLFGFGMLWAAVYFALPVVGALVYDLLTALILFAAVVFLGGLDRLEKDSPFFDRMKKVLAIPALVFAVLLFAGAVNGLTNLFPWLDAGRKPPAVAEAKGGFRRGAPADLETALALSRPAVLDFDATWCKVCKKLDRETLSDPRVVRALEGVEALKIDFDDQPELVKRFNILGVPTVVFLDAEGREREALRFSGAIPPEPFLEKLDALKRGQGPRESKP